MGRHEKKKAAPVREERETRVPELDNLEDWMETETAEPAENLPPEPQNESLLPYAEEESVSPDDPEVPVETLLPPLENVVPVRTDKMRRRAIASLEEKAASPNEAGDFESVKKEPVSDKRSSSAAKKAAASRREADPRRKASAPRKRTDEPDASAPSVSTGEKKKKALTPAQKEARARKRSRKKFRRGLRIYAIILAVIIVGAMVALWMFLDKAQKELDAESARKEQAARELAEKQAYEKAVYRAPQLAFETWYAGTDADYWTDLWYTANPENVDGRDRVRSYLADRFSPEKVQLYKAQEFTQDAPVYVLKDDSQTLARITLTGAETAWSVSSVELLLQGTESASVKVAMGSRVICNGQELGPEYAGEPSSYFTYDALRDQLVNPVSWVTYKVDGMLLPPELSVEPPAGCSVTETAEGDFLLCLDGDAGKVYCDKAVAFVRSYLFYYMSGGNGTWGNMYNVLAHLVQGTKAYQDIYDTYNGVYWNTAYSNIDTSDTTAGGVVIWADNVYSVDVSYNAKGYNPFSGKTEDYNSATIRVYFQQINGNFIISAFEAL